MNAKRLGLPVVGALILTLILLVLVSTQRQTVPVSAQGPGGGVIVVQDSHHDVSPPVRNVKASPVPPAPERAMLHPLPAGRHQDQPDAAIQRPLAAAAMPGPILNFDGIPFPGVGCGCAPPDANGAVGLTQYVQIVNEGLQVFSKTTGASVFGPVGISTLWSGFGGVCQTSGLGDPNVLYDQLADRWIIGQFAGPGVPTHECIAVSTSSDAAASYYRYDFLLGANYYDVPKLAVWPDAYYMSTEVFNAAGTARLGPQPFAFDRAAMLAGNAASFITPGITGGVDEENYLPANLDGRTLPPAGAPNSFVEWPSGLPLVYKVYHFHVDFAAPANSTFTLFASPPAAGFTQLCPNTRNCVPQAGSGDGLAANAYTLQFRLAYRNFGDHEAVVTNYTVSSGGVAGIRWLELRNVTNGPVTVYQESTYQPDTTWRWMGSAAMDRSGNLALGFSASSASISPQIRYAGRLASDPLNTLAQGEATLFAGTGSQTGTSNRWGDFSTLAVDPVDECALWYTNEYYQTTGAFNWRTRIGNFKFSSCVAAPPGPTPTATPTATPISCLPATRFSQSFDGVAAPALPTGWTATSAAGAAPLWVTSNAGVPAPVVDTAPNAAFVDDPASVSDKRLDSPSITNVGSNAQLTFRQNYNLESTFDGGVLEIRINGGAFTDILTAGGSFVGGSYNATISTVHGSPIAGRQAWSGSSGGFVTTSVNLPAATAGQTVQLRWRMGSDDSLAVQGWRIDTISITDCVALTATPTPTATVTPTRTATLTPTSTRTPTSTPTPFPRPNVGVQVAPSGGTLQSTITARDAGCAGGNNQLFALQFTRLANATVDVGNPLIATVATPTTVPLASHPASVPLTLRRVTAGQAATVELTVTDGCGAWPTIVGGGPTAF